MQQSNPKQRHTPLKPKGLKGVTLHNCAINQLPWSLVPVLHSTVLNIFSTEASFASYQHTSPSLFFYLCTLFLLHQYDVQWLFSIYETTRPMNHKTNEKNIYTIEGACTAIYASTHPFKQMSEDHYYPYTFISVNWNMPEVLCDWQHKPA